MRLIVAVLFLMALALPVRSQQGWVATQVAPAGQDLNTVFFLDNKRGWVGGDNGFLSRTEDGGHSWVKQALQTDVPINDIYFRDKEAGFLDCRQRDLRNARQRRALDRSATLSASRV